MKNASPGLRWSPVVQHVFSICEILGSIPSMGKKKKGRKKGLSSTKYLDIWKYVPTAGSLE
jgi:hypothetical protein